MSLRNPAKFMKGFGRVYSQLTRNPSTSGTIHGAMRTAMAAGSDSRKNGALTGPRVPMGHIARRDGHEHPQAKRDYWNQEDTKTGFRKGKQWQNSK